MKFFFDRNFGKSIPQALELLGLDVTWHAATYPSSGPENDDAYWIKEQSEQGRILVTQDTKIKYRPAEVGAIKQAKARGLLMRADVTRVVSATAFLKALPEVEKRISENDAPWLLRITNDGKCKAVEID